MAYEIPRGDSEGEAGLVQKVRKLTHQVMGCVDEEEFVTKWSLTLEVRFRRSP